MTVAEYAAKCARDEVESLSAGERDELRSMASPPVDVAHVDRVPAEIFE
jgi:hypothetical protein